MKTQILPPIPASIEKAVKLLNAKEVVALPTETVYGLAGSATSPEAVEKIFKAKNRPAFDPLIVHVREKILTAPEGPTQVLVQENILSATILQWPRLELLNSAMKKFWPGPLTLILPRGTMIPDLVTSAQNTVGIRCPAHPVFQAVLNGIPFPLAAPSANQFGKVSPTTAQHVFQELEGRIPAILDGGPCTVGVESTIIKIEDSPLRVTLLRPGKIGAGELQDFFKVPLSTKPTSSNPHAGAADAALNPLTAPGMLDEHYAPTKPLILLPIPFSQAETVENFLSDFIISEKCGFIGMTGIPLELKKTGTHHSKILSVSGALDEMAQNLFSTLRAFDRNPEIEMIFIDVPEESTEGLAMAIRDRLNRASRNKPL